MPRASICISVDIPEEVESGERWLAASRDRLDFISENYGCGCCVNLFDVEGAPEVLATLPRALQAQTEWTAGKALHGRPTAK